MRAVFAAGAAAAAAAAAAAEPPPVDCGHPGFVGLVSRAQVGADGRLWVRLTLTDAPISPLTVLPVAFADGLLVRPADDPDDGPRPAEPSPVALDCGVETVWREAVPPRSILHWTLLPWPPVPPALAELDADAAWRRYADRPPPGRFPWADVAWVPRDEDPGWPAVPPAGPEEDPAEAPDTGAAQGGSPDDGPALLDDGPFVLDDGPALLDDGPFVLDDGPALLDDGVTWRAGPHRSGAGYLARVRVGERLHFELRFHPGAAGAGRAWAVCLLDARQIAPFGGRPIVAAEFVAERAWAIEGEVVVPRPGWQRLTCLLLGGPGTLPGETAPRPLLSAFVWGDP